MPYLVLRADRARPSRSERVSRHDDLAEALAAIEAEPPGDVLLCDPRLAELGFAGLPADLDHFDLLHAGLSLGAAQTLRSLWLTTTTWFFLDPPAEQRCTSWKATAAFCWLRPEAVRALGGFDRAYQSGAMQLMDLAYRMLAAGGRVCHQPLSAPLTGLPALRPEIPLEDELLFIHRRIGRAAALYAAVWTAVLMRMPVHGLRSFLAAGRRARSLKAPQPSEQTSSWHVFSEAKRQQVGSVSAIIPTIGRYEYLPGAIDSLLRGEPQPEEILVVDQTPLAERRAEVYEPYHANGKVRVIYLDQAGQSIARNTALQAARGEWCLLFEDDTVAWDDLLAEHIQAVENSGAAASTGVSLAPWKTVAQTPERIRMFRIADVLATGNCLARKDALLAVGGLDEAFNRGSGADNDLGLRLYLKGYEIVTNPKAIQTHYKAPKGGMRIHGAWWRNHATTWGSFPQATQVYAIQRYYPREYWLPLYLLYYIKAREQMSPTSYAWLWLNSPWKLLTAIRAARKLRPLFIQPK